MYGSRGPDSGVFQFIMYGLVGFIPGIVASSLVHKFIEETPPPAKPAGSNSTEPTVTPPTEPTPTAA
jgi:hypothetical protein